MYSAERNSKPCIVESDQYSALSCSAFLAMLDNKLLPGGVKNAYKVFTFQTHKTNKIA